MANKDGVVSISFDYKKALNDAFNEIEGKMNDLGKNMGMSKEVEDEFAKVRGEFENLRSDIAGLYRDIANTKIDVSELQTFEKKVNSSIESMTKKISSFETALGKVPTNDGITKITEQFAAMQNTVSLLTNAISQLQQTAGGAGAAVDLKLTDKQSDLEKYTEMLKSLVSVKKQLEGSDVDIPGLSVDDLNAKELEEVQKILDDTVQKFKDTVIAYSKVKNQLLTMDKGTDAFKIESAKIMQYAGQMQQALDVINNIDLSKHGEKITNFPVEEQMDKWTDTVSKISDNVSDSIDGVIKLIRSKIDALKSELAEGFDDEGSVLTNGGAIDVRIRTRTSTLVKKLRETLEALQAEANKKPVIAPVKLRLDPTYAKSEKPNDTTKHQVEEAQKQLSETGSDIYIDLERTFDRTYAQALASATRQAQQVVQGITDYFKENPAYISFKPSQESVNEIIQMVLNPKDEVHLDIGEQMVTVRKEFERLYKEFDDFVKDHGFEDKLAKMQEGVTQAADTLAKKNGKKTKSKKTDDKDKQPSDTATLSDLKQQLTEILEVVKQINTSGINISGLSSLGDNISVTVDALSDLDLVLSKIADVESLLSRAMNVATDKQLNDQWSNITKALDAITTKTGNFSKKLTDIPKQLVPIVHDFKKYKDMGGMFNLEDLKKSDHVITTLRDLFEQIPELNDNNLEPPHMDKWETLATTFREISVELGDVYNALARISQIKFNSFKIEGVDKLAQVIEQIKTLTGSSSTKTVAQSLGTVIKDIIGANSMQHGITYKNSKGNTVSADAPERVIYADSNNGFYTNPYVVGTVEELSSKVVDAILANVDTSINTIDTSIHSHPHAIAAPSPSDIGTWVDSKSKGITKNFIAAFNEVLSFDTSNIPDDILAKIKNEFNQSLIDITFKNFMEYTKTYKAIQEACAYNNKGMNNLLSGMFQNEINRTPTTLPDDVFNNISAKLWNEFSSSIDLNSAFDGIDNDIDASDPKAKSILKAKTKKVLETYLQSLSEQIIKQAQASGNYSAKDFSDFDVVFKNMMSSLTAIVNNKFASLPRLIAGNEFGHDLQQKFDRDAFKKVLDKYGVGDAMQIMSVDEFAQMFGKEITQETTGNGSLSQIFEDISESLSRINDMTNIPNIFNAFKITKQQISGLKDLSETLKEICAQSASTSGAADGSLVAGLQSAVDGLADTITRLNTSVNVNGLFKSIDVGEAQLEHLRSAADFIKQISSFTAANSTNNDNDFLLTRPESNDPMKFYRTVNGTATGLFSNRYHGGTFGASNPAISRSYAQGGENKTYEFNLVDSGKILEIIPNKILLGGDDAAWNNVSYLGTLSDDLSKEIISLAQTIYSLKTIVPTIDSEIDNYVTQGSASQQMQKKLVSHQFIPAMFKIKDMEQYNDNELIQRYNEILIIFENFSDLMSSNDFVNKLGLSVFKDLDFGEHETFEKLETDFFATYAEIKNRNIQESLPKHDKFTLVGENVKWFDEFMSQNNIQNIVEKVKTLSSAIKRVIEINNDATNPYAYSIPSQLMNKVVGHIKNNNILDTSIPDWRASTNSMTVKAANAGYDAVLIRNILDSAKGNRGVYSDIVSIINNAIIANQRVLSNDENMMIQSMPSSDTALMQDYANKFNSEYEQFLREFAENNEDSIKELMGDWISNVINAYADSPEPYDGTETAHEFIVDWMSEFLTFKINIGDSLSSVLQDLDKEFSLFKLPHLDMMSNLYTELYSRAKEKIYPNENNSDNAASPIAQAVSELEDKFTGILETIQQINETGIHLDGLDNIQSSVKVTLDALADMEPLLQRITDLEATVARAGGVGTTEEVNAKWEEIQGAMEKLTNKSGDFDKRIKNVPEKLAPIIDAFKQYESMGGKFGLSDLTDNKNVLSQLTSAYGTIEQSSAEITDWTAKFQPLIDSLKSLTEQISLLTKNKTPLINLEGVDSLSKLIDKLGGGTGEVSITQEVANPLGAIFQELAEAGRIKHKTIDVQSEIPDDSPEHWFLANLLTGEHTNPNIASAQFGVTADIIDAVKNEYADVLDHFNTDIHTHPLRVAVPSPTDLLTWLKEKKEGIDHAIVVAFDEAFQFDIPDLDEEQQTDLVEEYDDIVNKIMDKIHADSKNPNALLDYAYLKQQDLDDILMPLSADAFINNAHHFAPSTGGSSTLWNLFTLGLGELGFTGFDELQNLDQDEMKLFWREVSDIMKEKLDDECESFLEYMVHPGSNFSQEDADAFRDAVKNMRSEMMLLVADMMNDAAALIENDFTASGGRDQKFQEAFVQLMQDKGFGDNISIRSIDDWVKQSQTSTVSSSTKSTNSVPSNLSGLSTQLSSIADAITKINEAIGGNKLFANLQVTKAQIKNINDLKTALESISAYLNSDLIHGLESARDAQARQELNIDPENIDAFNEANKGVEAVARASVEPLKDEAKQMRAITTWARKAAQAKEEFAKANSKVGASATESAENVEREASALAVVANGVSTQFASDDRQDFADEMNQNPNFDARQWFDDYIAAMNADEGYQRARVDIDTSSDGAFRSATLTYYNDELKETIRETWVWNEELETLVQTNRHLTDNIKARNDAERKAERDHDLSVSKDLFAQLTTSIKRYNNERLKAARSGVDFLNIGSVEEVQDALIDVMNLRQQIQDLGLLDDPMNVDRVNAARRQMENGRYDTQYTADQYEKNQARAEQERQHTEQVAAAYQEAKDKFEEYRTAVLDDVKNGMSGEDAQKKNESLLEEFNTIRKAIPTDLFDSQQNKQLEDFNSRLKQMILLAEQAYQRKKQMEDESLGVVVGEGTYGDIQEVKNHIRSITETIGYVRTSSITPIDMDTFEAELVKADNSIHKIKMSLDSQGRLRMLDKGVVAANQFDSALGKIKHKLAEIIRVNISPSKIMSFMRSGVAVLKDFDSALTTISYTMNITQKNLDSLGESIINMANDMGTSIDGAMSVAQIYANMNISEKEIQELAKPTIILSNLTGENASTAADQLQAVTQQFSLAAEESMHIVDVYDYISKNIAVDYAKGIRGMSEAVEVAGSTAEMAGMNFEQLSSIVAKTMEKTRQEGSQIGNGLKTIFTRLSKASNLSDEIDNDTLSNASKALHDIGIEVYTTAGEYREFDVVMTELAAKWDDLTDAQKSNISYQIAATRQTNLLTAVLSSWTDSMQLATDAAESDGNALENNEKYLDSYTGKLQQLETAGKTAWIHFLDTDAFKDGITLLTSLLKILDKIVEVAPTIPTLGGLMGGLYGRNVLFSSNGANQITLFGKTFSDLFSPKGMNETQFNSAMDLFAQGLSVSDVEKKLGKLDATILSMNPDVKKGAVSFQDYQKQLKSVGKMSELANLGSKALAFTISTLANAVISFAISAAFTWVYNEIKQMNTAIQETSDAVADLQQNAQAELSQAKELDALIETYKELSKGVGSNGERVSLSAQSYEEYLNVVSQIADLSPDLVAGYNAEGEAIIDLTNRVDALGNAYDNTTKKAYAQYVFEDTHKQKKNGNYKERASLTLTNLMNLSGATSEEQKKWTGFVFRNKNLNALKLGTEEKYNLAKAVASIESEQVQAVYSELIDQGFAATEIHEFLKQYGAVAISGEVRKYTDSYDVVQASIDAAAYKETIDDALASVRELGKAYSMLDDDYYNLSTAQQSAVQSIIKNLSLETAKGFDANEDRLQGWISDIIDIASDEQASTLFENLFSIDFSQVSNADAVNAIDNYIAQIQAIVDEKYGAGEFDISSLVFGYGFDKYTETQNAIQGALSKTLDTMQHGGGQTYYALRDAFAAANQANAEYLLNLLETLGSAEEALEEYANYMAEKSAEFSLSSYSTEIDNFQSTASTIGDALSKLRDGSLSSGEIIDLAQEFTDLDVSSTTLAADLQQELQKQLDELIESLGSNAPQTLIDYLKDIANEALTAAAQFEKLSDAVDSWQSSYSEGQNYLYQAKNGGLAPTDLMKLISSSKAFRETYQATGDQVAAVNAMIEETTADAYNYISSYVFDENAVSNEIQKISELGLDEYASQITSGTIQSVYGNIDMDKRTIITWSDELKQTYADALASWDYDPEIGSIDTVFGTQRGYGLFGGEKEFAISPILSTGEFLSSGVVDSYMQDIMSQTEQWVSSELANGTTRISMSDIYEHILSIDKNGADVSIINEAGEIVGNQYVQGIIGAIEDSNGISVSDVAKLMHFSGVDGAYSLAKNQVTQADIVEATKNLSEEYLKLQAYGISGVKDAIDSINSTYDLLKDVNKEWETTGTLSAETLDSIMADYPNAIEYVNEFLLDESEDTYSKIVSVLNDYYETDYANYELAAKLKVMEDEDFYQNNVLASAQVAVDALADQYGIDVHNFQNYILAKTKLYASSYSALSQMDSDYYRNLAESMKKYASTINNGTAQTEILKQADQYAAFADRIDNSINYMDLVGQIEGAFEKEFANKYDLSKLKSGLEGRSDKADAESSSNDIDWIQVKIERLERTISNLDDTVEDTYKSWGTRNNALGQELSKITEEINLQKAAASKYLELANKVTLDESYKAKVRNGELDVETITDQTLYDNIQKYKEYYEAYLKATDDADELQDTYVEKTRKRLDNLNKYYDDYISRVEHRNTIMSERITQQEALGHVVSSKYYSKQLSIQKQEQAKYASQLAEQIALRDKAVADGVIKMYSEEWYSWDSEIRTTQENLEKCNTEIINIEKNIRQISWDKFDKTVEMIKDATTETNFLLGLLDESKFYEDNGTWKNGANAASELHLINYNADMAEADKYAKEIKNINKQLAKDPYNTELLERRNSLLESQRASIEAANDEREAVKKLYEDGYNKLLDYLKEVSDEYMNTIEAADELADYEKNIADKTKNIANLRKQLLALQGDTSEETRAQIQTLSVSLSDAEEELQETEHERWKKDQQTMLTNMQDDMQEWIENRMDSFDEWFSETIANANMNAETNKATIEESAAKVGYTITDTVSTMLDPQSGKLGSVVAEYASTFNSYKTSVLASLTAIASFVEAMYKASDAEANTSISETSTATSGNKGSAKGYATGGTNIKDVFAWTQENGAELIRSADGALLTPVKGSTVFSKAQTEKLWELSQGKFDFDSLYRSGISKSITAVNSNSSLVFNGNIVLEGVNSPEEFAEQLRNSLVNNRKIQSTLQDTMNNWIGSSNSLKARRN